MQSMTSRSVGSNTQVSSSGKAGHLSDRGTYPAPKGKFRGELWTKKFKHMDESWTTCNREYGDFVSKRHILKMDGKDNETPDDGGPWMASSYQVGYNVKPEFRQKWLDSWKGYVKRKPVISSEDMKEIISPNTYKEKAPPMTHGEGWVDDGPWGQSTYQMGYNVPPTERQDKPIYRFTKDSEMMGYNKMVPPAGVRASVSEDSPYNSLSTLSKGKALKRAVHPGVKLPPIDNVPEKARQDIQLHKGEIYMKPSETEVKPKGINQRFFNFRYRDFWKPLPIYKTESLK